MIAPLHDVVIIRRSAPETVSAGGIHLAWDPDFKEDMGTVVFAGPGKAFECHQCKAPHMVKVTVKPGDRVIFSTNGHQVTTINGEELIVLREASIIGVIEDDTAESDRAAQVAA